MPFSNEYRGRFAPSPTGPLHFGSIVAAIGSYLDAKHHQGKWLLRIEDLDTTRTVKGATDDILRTLESFSLHWDETVLFQSQRTDAYEEALHKLQTLKAVYPCACTRKEIADSALHGIEGQIYPGTCRNGISAGREGRAWRMRTDRCPSGENGHTNRLSSNISPIQFTDSLQGNVTQHIETELGDFVIKRADGLFAYQLAVVVDDAFQGITQVTRGADLLSSTARQIYLQQLLQLATPNYMHLPIVVNTQGEKLSKQTLAAPVNGSNPADTLWHALEFLRQRVPAELKTCKLNEILEWATDHWDTQALKGITTSTM